MTKKDAIVIGGGVNGLVAACFLAKRGKKVTLLEKRDRLGGRADGVLFDTTTVWREVADHLSLQKHGLQYDETEQEIYLAEIDNDGLLLSSNLEKTKKEISKFSKKDAESYEEFIGFQKRIRPFMEKLLCDGPVDLLDVGLQDVFRLGKVGLALRSLGKKDMIEFLRVAPMCLGDYLGENFETDLLKSGLCFSAISGSYTGPWSPGNTLNLLIDDSMRETPIKGGMKSLVSALSACAKDLGVEIKTNCAVKEIKLEKGAVTAVSLQNGETLESNQVLSSLDPKRTFFDLMNPAYLDHQFESRLTHFRMRGTTSIFSFKTKSPLRFKSRPDLDWKHARIGEKLDDLERAFDAVKYGEHSQVPMMELFYDEQTVHAQVHFTPYHLRAGWTKEQTESLKEKIHQVMNLYFVDFENTITESNLMTPVDLENEYGLTEGNIYHGELAIDQFLVRAIPETAEYKTPFKGLTLCGSGSYPGGAITMGPGILGAKASLKS